MARSVGVEFPAEDAAVDLLAAVGFAAADMLILTGVNGMMFMRLKKRCAENC